MAKSVSIGDLHFSTKTEAVEFFKAMLYKYDLGDKVSKSDADILSEALQNHPDAQEKIGSGIASFSVRGAQYKTRCFWVNRTDGTTEKFSFRSCL